MWIFQPAGKPKDVVVFFHGQGGANGGDAVDHRPWIDHLVKRGSLVIYPRYELSYEPDPTPFVVKGVKAAMQRVDTKGLPVLAIGYSTRWRARRRVRRVREAERAAGTERDHGRVPGAGRATSGGSIRSRGSTTRRRSCCRPARTTTSWPAAAPRFLLGRLQAAGFPANRVQTDFVRSQKGLVANHFAPLQTTPAAKAEFWGVADRMLNDLD